MAADTTTSQLTQSESLTKDKQTHHVTALQAQTIFEAVEEGETLRSAAQKAGVSRQTAWRLMRSYEANVDAARKFMAAKALDRIEDWESASQKAAEKGDHRPAKDWLLHAGAIEPVNDGSQGGTRIAIMIGTPEKPIHADLPQVIDVQVDNKPI